MQGSRAGRVHLDAIALTIHKDGTLFPVDLHRDCAAELTQNDYGQMRQSFYNRVGSSSGERKMKIDLSDQVALVTGAARRVGKAIAVELARQGVHILVHYNSTTPEDLRETMLEIKSSGVDAFEIQSDLNEAAGVNQVMEAVQARFGRLNILVNSASIFQKRRLMEVTVEEWEQTMHVNVRAPFLLTQAAVPLMRANTPSGGVIINICDRGADLPWPDYAHHGVSKAALLALSQVSAVSLGPEIRVNAIIPGPVMKPAGRAVSDAEWAKVGEVNPLKITGEAGDVGRAAVYLASESFLTGAVIHVNGGEHLI